MLKPYANLRGAEMKCPECAYSNPADTLFCGRCGSSLRKPKKRMPAATRTLKIATGELVLGTDFAGRYQIIEDLGQGGMGHVYKVIDKEINEVIALKVLKQGLLETEQVVARFHNELKLARRISHKNVCGLYHLGKDENETFYITMEYVSGEDLKSLIRRVGQLTVGKAVFIAKQICEGLSEAHRLGVLHRDLKPQNIMIDRNGHVRIMDFGIARSRSAKGHTAPHTIVGTPDYMSPEQLEGQDTDHRTDIYSLGLILYEMLTGRLPHDVQAGMSVVLIQKSRKPPSPRSFNPHIPDSLCQTILRCLDKKREKRFDDVMALHRELGRIESALHLTTSAPNRRNKTQKITMAIRSKLRWRYAVPVIAVLAGLFLAAWLFRGPGGYDTYISLTVDAADATRSQQRPVEFVLTRAVSASTRLYVFVHDDLLTYKKRTESGHEIFRPALLTITADIMPKIIGYDISLTTRFRGRSARQVFDCKGDLDFLTRRVDDILAFLMTVSKGLVRPVESGAKFAQICTSDTDALRHFLTGEEAWKILDPERAFYEYRTALENDPSFALAHLRLADVHAFRSDFEPARRHLDEALSLKVHLIELDLLRLYALRARLDHKPNEERQFLGQLTEEFPFKKEYHYEFAESYFHCGAADEAIGHYLKALALDETYVLAHNHLAYCYSWKGDHERALRHFERSQALDPTANSSDSLAAGLMFAGDYARALAVVEEGTKADPQLDYLYANRGRNLILQGKLASAEEAFGRQAAIASREFTKTGTGFWLAFIEYLRGHSLAATNRLAPVYAVFRQPPYEDRLDESPNLPSWLNGIMAADRGDLEELQREIGWMENKILRHHVSATSFFPVLKLCLHLKMLAAVLQKDPLAARNCVEEVRRIQMKMGYRSSFFNKSYLYNAFAEALITLGDPASLREARVLAQEANAYNPQYPWTHVNLAALALSAGNDEEFRTESELAERLLAGSDSDYAMMKAVRDLRARARR